MATARCMPPRTACHDAITARRCAAGSAVTWCLGSAVQEELPMSTASRLMIGITLLTVPTIVLGGLTVLGVVTDDRAGLPGPELTALQATLYRAGHAHAGVLVILSLVLQLLLDHVRLAQRTAWSARVAAPLAAVLVPGGFFGLAHAPPLRVLLYAGAALIAYATLTVGVGLLRSLRPEARAATSRRAIPA